SCKAEDSIRSFHVTVVQTCALPIWGCRCRTTEPPSRQAESNPIRLLRAALWSGIYTPGYVASVLLLIGGMGVITRFGACLSLKKSEATERISLSKRSLDRKTSLD